MDVTGYQLDNNEVALVVEHDVVEHDEEDQIAYSVVIIDQNKEVVATYSCKADSKLDAVKTGMESTDVDKFAASGHGDFVKLTDAEVEEINKNSWERYIIDGLKQKPQLKPTTYFCDCKGPFYACPGYGKKEEYFRIHQYHGIFPLSTITFHRVEGEQGKHKYIFHWYKPGVW